MKRKREWYEHPDWQPVTLAGVRKKHRRLYSRWMRLFLWF